MPKTRFATRGGVPLPSRKICSGTRPVYSFTNRLARVQQLRIPKCSDNLQPPAPPTLHSRSDSTATLWSNGDSDGSSHIPAFVHHDRESSQGPGLTQVDPSPAFTGIAPHEGTRLLEHRPQGSVRQQRNRADSPFSISSKRRDEKYRDYREWTEMHDSTVSTNRARIKTAAHPKELLTMQRRTSHSRQATVMCSSKSAASNRSGFSGQLSR